jgi:chromate reductase
MRLLGIIGSLRDDSYNAMLLRAAAEMLPPGVELAIYEGLAEIPAFDEDLEGSVPAAVEALKSAIAEADAVLFATPEYNASIPGFLKNALDWVSRPTIEHTPLRNKPAAVIGTSTGMFGAVWAQAELRKVLGTIGARALDRDTPVPFASAAFDADGVLVDEDARETVASAVADLVEMVREREALRAAA